MTDTCSSCIYSRKIQTEKLKLICRRYPPLARDNQRYGDSAVVHVNDWCGEHKRNDA